MARARNIKPGFFKNELLAECSPWARLCFAGLWTLADRKGRLEDRPKRIKGELFAFDSIEVDPLLAELEGHGFLVRYKNLDGSFIQITKFLEHQSPHYSEKDSVIKPPNFQESNGVDETRKPETLQENSKNHSVIKRGSQPPDSLIPSSLKEDSLHTETGCVSDCAKAVLAMRAAGLFDANPNHPDVQALIDAGATTEEFEFAATEAVAKGKKFAYALGVVKGRRREAEQTAKLTISPKVDKSAALERANNAAVADFLKDSTNA